MKMHPMTYGAVLVTALFLLFWRLSSGPVLCYGVDGEVDQEFVWETWLADVMQRNEGVTVEYLDDAERKSLVAGTVLRPDSIAILSNEPKLVIAVAVEGGCVTRVIPIWRWQLDLIIGGT